MAAVTLLWTDLQTICRHGAFCLWSCGKHFLQPWPSLLPGARERSTKGHSPDIPSVSKALHMRVLHACEQKIALRTPTAAARRERLQYGPQAAGSALAFLSGRLRRNYIAGSQGSLQWTRSLWPHGQKLPHWHTQKGGRPVKQKNGSLQ